MFSIFNGFTVGAYLLTTFPSESIKNFVKFHLISLLNKPFFSFFKNLYKLETDDEVSIFYGGSEYKYKVVNQYDIEKTGTANIVRNAEKSTLTLITCRHNTNKQIIYICELVEKV